jgi:hypothetical protein
MSAASSHEASWGRLRGDVDNTAGEAALTGASYVDDRHGGCMALAKGVTRCCTVGSVIRLASSY